MTNFCVKNSLGILNTYFKHKNNHLVTFHSNDGHTTKTLDYAISSQMLSSYCLDCRVKNNYLSGTTLNSDHRCLIQRWAIPLLKIDRLKPRQNHYSKKSSIDCNSLRDPVLHQRFIENLVKLKELPLQHSNINSQVATITDELTDTADKILLKKTRKHEPLPWPGETTMS